MIFCIFYQVNLTESGLFKKDWGRNRLITLSKMQTKIIFLIEKIEISGSIGLVMASLNISAVYLPPPKKSWLPNNYSIN